MQHKITIDLTDTPFGEFKSCHEAAEIVFGTDYWDDCVMFAIDADIYKDIDLHDNGTKTVSLGIERFSLIFNGRKIYGDRQEIEKEIAEYINSESFNMEWHL